MKNWKTTFCGLISLIGSLGLASWPEHAKGWIFTIGLGAGLLGIFTKDAKRDDDGGSGAGPRIGLFALTALILGTVFALTGCVQVSGTRTPDGQLTISTHRFFWASEGINFTVRDTNGFGATLAVQRSTVDSAAIGAVAQGVAAGMVQGAK